MLPDLPDDTDEPDMVTIIMHEFSLLDSNYRGRLMDDELPAVNIKVPVAQLWLVFGDDVDMGPMTPTLTKLNDAALTLASMLITVDEYRTMRAAIVRNQ